MSFKNDFKINNGVVYSNNLIRSMWQMTATNIKIFDMAVSCLDTRTRTKDQRTVSVSKRDIIALMNVSKASGRSTAFKEQIQSIQNAKILIAKNDAMTKFDSVVLVPKISWGTKDDDDEVLIQFHEDVMPFLVELRDNFVHIKLEEMRGLHGKYALILHRLLVSNFKEKRAHYIGLPYNKKKGMTFIIEVKELRRITDTLKEYSLFADFEKWVIKKAVDEINHAFTSIVIKYDKIKAGRAIQEIRFHVRERLSTYDNDFDKPIEMKGYYHESNYDDLEIADEQLNTHEQTSLMFGDLDI